MYKFIVICLALFSMFAQFPWQDPLLSHSHFCPLQLRQTTDPASTPKDQWSIIGTPADYREIQTSTKSMSDPPDSVQVSLISNEQLATSVGSKPRPITDGLVTENPPICFGHLSSTSRTKEGCILDSWTPLKKKITDRKALLCHTYAPWCFQPFWARPTREWRTVPDCSCHSGAWPNSPGSTGS